MNVREVCNREVVIVNRDQTILEAAKLMREYHVGNVIVVEEKEGERVPVGILTDRDIVIKILAKDLDANIILVGDAMSFELLTAKEEDGVLETVKSMRGKGVRRIPVVNGNGGLEGIVAVDDLVDLVAEQMADLAALVKIEQRQEQTTRP